jgi:hypothetical protein
VTKNVWKFGPNWAGMKNGKRKLFKTRKQAAAYAGTKKKGKTKTKKKSRARRAGGAIKKRARKRAARSVAKMGSKRKAISVNLAKTVAIAGSAAIMSGAVGGLSVASAIRSGNWADAMARLYINFKNNWMKLLALNVGVALLGRIAGRFAPKTGIPGAISVKTF